MRKAIGLLAIAISLCACAFNVMMMIPRTRHIEPQPPQTDKIPYLKTLGRTDSFWLMPFSRIGYDGSNASFILKATATLDGVPNESKNGSFIGSPIGWYQFAIGWYSGTKAWKSGAYLGSTLNVSGSVTISDCVDPSQKNTYEIGNTSDVGFRINGVEYGNPNESLRSITGLGVTLGGVASSETTATSPTMITVYGFEFTLNGVLLGKFVPSMKDGVAGMTNELNGDFYPASNCIYGEEETSSVTPYIETDGVASYMDLGFVPTTEFKCDVQFKFESVKHSTNAQYNRAFGADNSNLPTGWHYSIGIGGSPSVVNIVNPMFTTSIQWNDKVRVEIDSDIIVDGEVVQSGITKNAAVSTMKVGCSMPSNANTFGNARIYSAKFWESGVLIRDLVPYSGPRGVGLLDKVNDVLYTNANTSGTLTYGEE